MYFCCSFEFTVKIKTPLLLLHTLSPNPRCRNFLPIALPEFRFDDSQSIAFVPPPRKLHLQYRFCNFWSTESQIAKVEEELRVKSGGKSSTTVRTSPVSLDDLFTVIIQPLNSLSIFWTKINEVFVMPLECKKDQSCNFFVARYNKTISRSLEFTILECETIRFQSQSVWRGLSSGRS